MESRALIDTYDEVAVPAPTSTTPALRLAHTAVSERAERPAQQRPIRAARHGEPWRYVLNGVEHLVTVSVIVPARNEAANLARLLEELPPVYEVILVDGNSVDGTVEVARAALPSVRVVGQPGKGKGDAMRAGLNAATGDISVFIDADGSNVAAEVERFVLAVVVSIAEYVAMIGFALLLVGRIGVMGFGWAWLAGETLVAVMLAGLAWRTRHIDLGLVRAAVTARRVPNAAAPN